MPMSVVEAGRRGGLTVLANRGRQFYAEIGRNGQKAMRAKYPDSASEWGRKGGRPRKPNLKNMGRGANSLKGRMGPALKHATSPHQKIIAHADNH